MRSSRAYSKKKVSLDACSLEQAAEHTRPKRHAEAGLRRDRYTWAHTLAPTVGLHCWALQMYESQLDPRSGASLSPLGHCSTTTKIWISSQKKTETDFHPLNYQGTDLRPNPIIQFLPIKF